MAREPHSEGLVAMSIVPPVLIRIVKQEFYEELVKHFVKDDSRSEKSGGQSVLRRSSPEVRTQTYRGHPDRDCICVRVAVSATTSVVRPTAAAEFSRATEKSLGDTDAGF